VFYGCWDWRFLGLIWLSTGVDYAFARAIGRSTDERRRLWLLQAGLVFNLGILGVFKYANFFVGSWVDLMGLFGIRVSWTSLHIILPVGISFYTFQALGYLIDVYRKRIEPIDDPVEHGLFIAFFPQLVSGPIERATHMLPQLRNARVLSLEVSVRASYLILLGLFKKAVADGLAPSVDAVFAQAQPASGSQVLLAVYVFCLQIYADFSGYTDIARGVAKLFGIDLVENFMTPYFSASPAEYWTRWHISLSTWVRDYVYTPMAIYFMRKSERRIEEFKPHVYSMVLMGLWHGAAWTYVVWGLYHGLLLVLWAGVRWPKRLRPWRKRVPRAAWMVVFFQLTGLGMLIFRADTLQQLGTFVHALFFQFGTLPPTFMTPPMAALLGAPILVLLDIVTYLKISDRFYETWPRPARAGLYAVISLLLAMGSANEPAKFIYFQF